jgi:Zn finger protein HypA/HybF involved in hydrogenase expression
VPPKESMVQINKIQMNCKRCLYQWIYKGNGIYYTSCPKCHTTVNIRKGIDLNKVQL